MQYPQGKKDRILFGFDKFSGSMQTEANSQDFSLKKMQSMPPSVSLENLCEQSFQEERRACARYLFAGTSQEKAKQMHCLSKLYRQKMGCGQGQQNEAQNESNPTVLEYFLQKWLIGMDYMKASHKKYIISRLSLHFQPSSPQMSIALKAYDKLSWAGIDRLAWIQDLCKNGWEWWIRDIYKKITLPHK